MLTAGDLDLAPADLRGDLLLGIGLLPDRGSTIRFHLHVAVQHKPRCKAPRSLIKRIARCNIGHPTLPPACWPKDRLSVSPRSERSRRKRDGRRMTYCLGIRVATGLVCLADGRTTSCNHVTSAQTISPHGRGAAQTSGPPRVGNECDSTWSSR